MEAAFVAFVEQAGYLAVFALILLENVFPPIPSELILPLAGFATTHTSMVMAGAIAAATAGSVLGAYILYAVGRILSAERLEAFFNSKPLRALGFKADDVTRALSWFNTKGQLTVLVCRCVPVLRSLISIPAGMARMHMLRFFVYTLVGSLIWNSVLIALGAAAGSAWQHVAHEAAWIADIFKVILALVVVIVTIIWYVKRMRPARAAKRL